MRTDGQDTVRVGQHEREIAVDDVDFGLFKDLTTSETRAELLLQLLQEPSGKSELAEVCDISNSTAYRHIQTFDERDWVEYSSNGQYELTPIGERIATELNNFVAGISHIGANDEFLRFYRGEYDIPIEVLKTGTMETATGANAQYALQEYMDAIGSELAEGTDVRMFGGTTGPIMINVIKELITKARTLEVIADTETIQGSTSGFGERAKAGDLPDHFDLFAYPGDLKFGVIILGDAQIRVGAYDERGDIQAGFRSSASVAIDWGNMVYESVREDSGPVGEIIPDIDR